MAEAQRNQPTPETLQKTLLYHFCRLRFPTMSLSVDSFNNHLSRCFELYQVKLAKEDRDLTWAEFLENLYTVDWFLCCACLEGSSSAWDHLFASRAYRSDSLLVDALRARAVRLFPHNDERQESAVLEFWGYLLAGQREGSVAILARYDGQRPLVPWLIRVFQNHQISELRANRDDEHLPPEELESEDLPFPSNEANGRWHEEFRESAREWLATLKEQELLLLGLRHRYRLSQRDVAVQLGIHEGNVSRQFTKLSERFDKAIRQSLIESGWMGDDLDEFIRTEMGSLLMEDPRLSADHLASLLAARGGSIDEVKSND